MDNISSSQYEIIFPRGNTLIEYDKHYILKLLDKGIDITKIDENYKVLSLYMVRFDQINDMQYLINTLNIDQIKYLKLLLQSNIKIKYLCPSEGFAITEDNKIITIIYDYARNMEYPAYASILPKQQNIAVTDEGGSGNTNAKVKVKRAGFANYLFTMTLAGFTMGIIFVLIVAIIKNIFF